VKLLTCLVIGLYRPEGILVFKKMGGGAKVMGCLHDICVRVVPSEGVSLLKYVVSRLNRRNLKWAMLRIESRNGI
jgi:hypothetical protein